MTQQKGKSEMWVFQWNISITQDSLIFNNNHDWEKPIVSTVQELNSQRLVDGLNVWVSLLLRGGSSSGSVVLRHRTQQGEKLTSDNKKPAVYIYTYTVYVEWLCAYGCVRRCTYVYFAPVFVWFFSPLSS